MLQLLRGAAAPVLLLVLRLMLLSATTSAGGSVDPPPLLGGGGDGGGAPGSVDSSASSSLPSSQQPWSSSVLERSTAASPPAIPSTRVTGYGSRSAPQPGDYYCGGFAGWIPPELRNRRKVWRVVGVDDHGKQQDDHRHDHSHGGGATMILVLDEHWITKASFSALNGSGKNTNNTDCSGTTTNNNSCRGVLISTLPDGSIQLEPQHGDHNNASAITPNSTFSDNDKERTSCLVEGLYGVYRIPSGQLWVWIADSEVCYEAPSLPNHNCTVRSSVNATTTTNTAPSSLLSQSQKQPPWWQIRRVTRLHLTRSPIGTGLWNFPFPLSRAQRAEEHRQLELLRKALKHHDWYFCDTLKGGDGDRGAMTAATPRVSDFTHHLQSSLRHSSFIGDGNGDASSSGGMAFPPHRPWWSSNDRSDDGGDASKKDSPASSSSDSYSVPAGSNTESVPPLQPDSRFFWNEAVLDDLIHNHRNSDAGQFLLRGAIPITSAFVGIRTRLPLPPSLDSDESEEKGTSGEKHGTHNNRHTYDHLLVTRRSRYRAGTRFTRRGADHTGAVANYAETEQIVVVRQRQTKNERDEEDVLHSVASHVQTRGSVPLRWSSPADVKTYRPRVRIGTDPLAQARAVALHLADQLQRFGHGNKASGVPTAVTTSNATAPRQHPNLVLVNLVDRTSDQGRLGRAFDAVLRAVLEVYRSGYADHGFASAATAAASFPPGSVQHIWYDFHAEVQHGRWGRLAHLLEQVDGPLREHGYFSAVSTVNDREEDRADTDCNPTFIATAGLLRVERLQSGLVRTNCMDCLDRTNVVQGMLGRAVLFRQLSDAGLIPQPKFRDAFAANPLSLPWEEGEQALRMLWADNADAVSRLYAGTPALKGDFTRTGKRTKRGALGDGVNSLHRYYRNNFRDADRQEGIDLLVGYRPFAGLTDEPYDHSENAAVGAVHDGDELPHHALLSLHEAAHRSLLGNGTNEGEADQRHVPIKWVPGRQLHGAGAFGVRSAHQPLDAPELRWLPGDLRTQVRGLLAAPGVEADAAAVPGPSWTALHALDERATSDAPWWVTGVESSSDPEPWHETQVAKAVLADAEMAAINNPGYLMGAMVAGTTSPVATAMVVLAIMVTSFLSESNRRDMQGDF